MGKLIVLEGTDGSGKSTQMERLAARLEQEGVRFRRLRFPRYDCQSSALIRLYLGGAFGEKPDDVNAYAASMFYAVDRYASYAEDWKDFYQAGGVLIADRYTTSNAVHQGSKLLPAEREAFFRWLYDLEYEKMQLPKPDLVLCLDMPTEAAEQLMRSREQQTNTHADIHERDDAYLRKCREAMAAAAAYYGWKTVPCAEGGQVRTIDAIHEEIYRAVRACLEG